MAAAPLFFNYEAYRPLIWSVGAIFDVDSIFSIIFEVQDHFRMKTSIFLIISMLEHLESLANEAWTFFKGGTKPAKKTDLDPTSMRVCSDLFSPT